MPSTLLKVASKPRQPLTGMQIMRKRERRRVEKSVVPSAYRADRETVVKSLYQALATEIACVLRYKRDDFKAPTANAGPSHAEGVDVVTRRAMSELSVMNRDELIADRTTLKSDRETAGYRFEQDPTTRLLDEILAEEENTPTTLGSASRVYL